jgi:H+/gluconate symporter-like permease
MRVGLAELNKQEEKIFAFSFLSGGFLGIPLAIMVGFLFHLPLIPPKPTGIDIVGWLTYNTLLGIYISAWWWLMMVMFSLLLYKRERRSNSLQNIKKTLFTSIVVPAIWILIIPFETFIGFPLTLFLLQYYSPFATFWTHALVATPFVIFGVYIVIPSLRPRIRHQLRLAVTRRFWRKTWKNPKSRRKIEIFILLLIILVILHILPAFS